MKQGELLYSEPAQANQSNSMSAQQEKITIAIDK